MSWRWVSITALLAALVVGYGVLTQQPAEEQITSAAPERPGYYLMDAVISQMQQDGSLGMRLSADRIEQRPRDDSFVMSAVRVNYFQAPQREWDLSAREGFVPANSRIIELHGDVLLRPAQGSATQFLRTQTLAIDTLRNVAYSTNSPVQIRFGQHALTVKGFIADLNQDTIRLESVNGRYDP